MERVKTYRKPSKLLMEFPKDMLGILPGDCQSHVTVLYDLIIFKLYIE